MRQTRTPKKYLKWSFLLLPTSIKTKLVSIFLPKVFDYLLIFSQSCLKLLIQ